MKKNAKSPSVIDLFAGAGGLTEGLRLAGYRSILANEYDEMAARTFSHNHPKIPIIVRDIKKLSVSEVMELSGVESGKLNLICGGPPCQGFSLAGQRLDDDPRNEMFREFVRIVQGLKPEVFLFENVSGIMSMAGGGVLKAILAEFHKIGYTCEYSLLNAAAYGVPQLRKRFILIGSRDGKHIGPPPPTHTGKPGELDFFIGALSPYLTTWDALGDLPQLVQGEGAQELDFSATPRNEYQRERRGIRVPGKLFNHQATRHSKIIIERYSVIPEGGDNSQVPEHLRTKKINVFKLHRNTPARTVTCNHRTDLLHPIIPRGTTVREAARLQSFDDDYQFFGNLTRKARWVTQDDQVGNAVPPLLAKAIGLHIKKEMQW